MTSKLLATLAAAALLVVALPAGAATVTTQKAWTFKGGAPSGLQVDNLMGNVVVERNAAAEFHVTVTVVAGGKDDAAARQLAEALRFETADSGAVQSLKVIYPLRAYKAFLWPSAPRASFWGSMGTEYLGERVKLSGDAATAADVHVDVLIRMPADAKLTVRNPLGSLLASGVQGDVSFDSGEAPQTLRDSTGSFSLDTGSGRVNVQRVKGRVTVDTGSGDAEISGCSGRISADTGSGSVRVLASDGSLNADTGSGEVAVDGFKGTIAADTGSGAVRVANLSGAAEIDADTGSGSVRLQGDLSALRRLKVDTGSGSVEMVTSALPSLEVVIDTGSGGVHIDAPTTASREDEDGRRIVTFGAGEGRGVIDTGSGSVSIRLATVSQGPTS